MQKKQKQQSQEAQQEQPAMPAPEVETTDVEQDQLSEVWRELLGLHAQQKEQREASGEATSSETIPTLNVDPWRDLVRSQGIEEVDLQQLRLRFSDQEVETILQIIKDQDD